MKHFYVNFSLSMIIASLIIFEMCLAICPQGQEDCGEGCVPACGDGCCPKGYDQCCKHQFFCCPTGYKCPSGPNDDDNCYAETNSTLLKFVKTEKQSTKDRIMLQNFEK